MPGRWNEWDSVTKYMGSFAKFKGFPRFMLTSSGLPDWSNAYSGLRGLCEAAGPFWVFREPTSTP